MKNLRRITLLSAVFSLLLTAACTGRSIPNDGQAAVPETTLPAAVQTEAASSPCSAGPDEPTRFTSSRGILLSASRDALEGKFSEEDIYTIKDGGVLFGFDNGVLTAYAGAMVRDEPENPLYELLDPITTFPGELGERARVSIVDRIRKYLNPDVSEDASSQLFGFYGDDYVIFTDSPFHGTQAAAVFAKDQSGEWVEIPMPEAYCVQVTGGCMLSDRIGFLCFADRSLMNKPDYTPRELTVYATHDGGASWEDLDIWIPEEFEGTIAPPVHALSPLFDGDHGVMPVSYSSYNSASDGFDSHTAWFESFDGGNTWVFRP